MKKETKKTVDTIFSMIANYKTKVGANDIAYKMQLDLLKASVKDEVEIQKATEYLVEKLIANKLWKISRVSFNTKEIYKARLIKFQEQLVQEGILVKDKLCTNRFLLTNDNTNEYFVVTANISKCAMPKEITRYEMVTGERGSKKKVLETQKVK